MFKALIIGIDQYSQNPLSSAVRDALAFKNELTTLGLASETDIALFTSPAQPGGIPAVSKSITDWLFDNIYMRGDALERFVFYYSGHGILAFSNAAQTRTRTALVPSDVADLKRDGRLLIDFAELLDVLSLTGPQEQLYFVDACRDMPYEQQPDVASLGWSGRPPGSERSQSCIFAVSPLGKARGARDGMGVMTSYLLEALRGEGMALEYANFQYIVSMRSICAHARAKVLQTLINEPAWKQKYQLPTYLPRGPEPEPLRTFMQVDPVPLTVHIVPDEAADQTQVKFSVGNYELDEKYCYPRNRNHDTVQLQPQRHLMIATSALGTPEPSREPVDVRVTHELTITLPKGHVPPSPPPESGVLPASTSVGPATSMGMGLAPMGILEAEALEPQTEIVLQSLSPPYLQWRATKHFSQSVLPRAYKVQFRLGPDVFSEQEVFVRAGEHVRVTPVAAVTPLLFETVASDSKAPSVVVSESIGPMQAAVLPTVLPIIGIKPFDRNNELFHKFSGLIETADAAKFDYRPLSLVLAVDGHSWKTPVPQILNGIRCSIAALDGSRRQNLVPLPALARVGNGLGFERLFRTMTPAPLGSFVIRLSSDDLGELTLASAGLPNRVTVVTAVFRPDGTVDVSQNILPIPGARYPENQSMPSNYGRVLRALQIGQVLFRSGELFQSTRPSGGDDISALLMAALYAKWVDPILGCMAYYAAATALATGAPGSESFPHDILRTAATNLNRYFPELPDSSVIYACEFPGQQLKPELFSGKSLPLLAESVWEVARRAQDAGQKDAPIVRLSRSIVADQPWLHVPMLVKGPHEVAATVTSA